MNWPQLHARLRNLTLETAHNWNTSPTSTPLSPSQAIQRRSNTPTTFITIPNPIYHRQASTPHNTAGALIINLINSESQEVRTHAAVQLFRIASIITDQQTGDHEDVLDVIINSLIVSIADPCPSVVNQSEFALDSLIVKIPDFFQSPPYVALYKLSIQNQNPKLQILAFLLLGKALERIDISPKNAKAIFSSFTRALISPVNEVRKTAYSQIINAPASLLYFDLGIDYITEKFGMDSNPTLRRISFQLLESITHNDGLSLFEIQLILEEIFGSLALEKKLTVLLATKRTLISLIIGDNFCDQECFPLLFQFLESRYLPISSRKIVCSALKEIISYNEYESDDLLMITSFLIHQSYTQGLETCTTSALRVAARESLSFFQSGSFTLLLDTIKITPNESALLTAEAAIREAAERNDLSPSHIKEALRILLPLCEVENHDYKDLHASTCLAFLLGETPLLEETDLNLIISKTTHPSTNVKLIALQLIGVVLSRADLPTSYIYKSIDAITNMNNIFPLTLCITIKYALSYANLAPQYLQKINSLALSAIAHNDPYVIKEGNNLLDLLKSYGNSSHRLDHS